MGRSTTTTGDVSRRENGQELVLDYGAEEESLEAKRGENPNFPEILHGGNQRVKIHKNQNRRFA